MPVQEMFLQEEWSGRQLQVLKTYDRMFAREAFDQMDTEAITFLRVTLDNENVASPGEDDADEALWEAVEDGAREDWNSFSYFVVTEAFAGHTVLLFVSSDWSSSEAYVKTRVAALKTAVV
jgi:hypothetical protein